MSKQINVVGRLTIQAGQMDTVKAALTELAQETRKEPGNIEYLILEDTETPNTMFSIEKWENAEAEAKHWETEHLKTAFAKIENLLAAEPLVNKGHEV